MDFINKLRGLGSLKAVPPKSTPKPALRNTLDPKTHNDVLKANFKSKAQQVFQEKISG